MTDRTIQVARATTGDASGRTGSPVPGALLAAALSAGLVCGLARVLAEPWGVTVALGVFAAGTALMLAALPRSFPHAAFGVANVVTLIRLALVAVLVGALAEPEAVAAAAWGVPAVAAVALALDGVDGWLARRTGLVSQFGARFDMEVDCALALTLALLVIDEGTVGPWIILLGLPRYVFWVASWVAPWLDGPLPERRSRKVVCVAQILVLILLASPLAGPAHAPLLALPALAVVGWSFAVDVRHLHRARG